MGSPIVVMGVSGSGKSTVGAALAQRLRVPFADADDFHPTANIEKMTAGTPLKRKYRDQLRRHCPDVTFLHLAGSPETIGRRQASRPGHFMPATLLASQFETLEPLAADERGVSIDVDQDIDSVVDTYLALSATRATEEEKK